MRWWTSDLHLGHANAIKHSSRPFKDVDEMNSVLMQRWNSRVSPEDTVFFLGDFSMSWRHITFLNQLNFKELTWILGNHDDKKKILREMHSGCLQNLAQKISLHESATAFINGIMFSLSHAPLDAQFGFPILCGHVHEQWKFHRGHGRLTELGQHREPRSRYVFYPAINAGVDQHDFYPINDLDIWRIYHEISLPES